MISGKVKHLSTMELINMMNKQGSGSLGRIFLNFSSPVGIKDYLKSINVTSLNSSNIDKVGYRITQELYLEHH
jgi:hypothetical protein